MNAKQNLLNALNDELAAELVATKGDVVAAVNATAGKWQLALVAESRHPVTGEYDDVCRIYWSRQAKCHVNCWLEAPSAAVEPGGIGFDDQTEWWEDAHG